MSVSSLSSASRRKVTLKSSNGETFEVQERIVLKSGTIKQLLEVNAEPKTIPVHNVTGRVLSLVISYLSRHASPVNTAKVLENGDVAFIKVNRSILLELLLVSDLLIRL
ncbi:hypothetical protein CDL15_Pgr020812 [Punica granatum]|nr:hypothetical protein CDL15_Pgr020812 [Punica granatum]